MRHSTPMLTLNTYGHLLEGAEARTVQTLNVGAQQICSKLSAAEKILDAAGCDTGQEIGEVETKKDPGKTTELKQVMERKFVKMSHWFCAL